MRKTETDQVNPDRARNVTEESSTPISIVAVDADGERNHHFSCLPNRDFNQVGASEGQPVKDWVTQHSADLGGTESVQIR